MFGGEPCGLPAPTSVPKSPKEPVGDGDFLVCIAGLEYGLSWKSNDGGFAARFVCCGEPCGLLVFTRIPCRGSSLKSPVELLCVATDPAIPAPGPSSVNLGDNSVTGPYAGGGVLNEGRPNPKSSSPSSEAKSPMRRGDDSVGGTDAVAGEWLNSSSPSSEGSAPLCCGVPFTVAGVADAKLPNPKSSSFPSWGAENSPKGSAEFAVGSCGLV